MGVLIVQSNLFCFKSFTIVCVRLGVKSTRAYGAFPGFTAPFDWLLPPVLLCCLCGWMEFRCIVAMLCRCITKCWDNAVLDRTLVDCRMENQLNNHHLSEQKINVLRAYCCYLAAYNHANATIYHEGRGKHVMIKQIVTVKKICL